MGLLITQDTQPSDDGQGYLWSPGIYTDKHIEGWKKVTHAVHEAGGSMYIQLMHASRMSHPDNILHHRQPVAPSIVFLERNEISELVDWRKMDINLYL